MMSDSKSLEDKYNVEFWRNRWMENKLGWQESDVHPCLLTYIGMLTGQKSVSTEPVSDPKVLEQNGKKTWFVPLCGKTLDIPYLLSQGFNVFGVEAVKKAIEDLSDEHSLNLVYNEEEHLFTGVNGRLRIYVGDFFTAPLEKFGPVDYVWDRGSFVAIEYPFREKYVETMQKILRNPDGTWYDFKYLLESCVYDKSKFAGPPRAVDDDDLKKYFESWAKLTFLSSKKLPVGHRLFNGIPEDIGQTIRNYLITPS